MDLRSALGWTVRLYVVALFGVGVYSAVWLYRVWWRAQDARPYDSVFVSVGWFGVAGLGALVVVSLVAFALRTEH